MAVNDLGSAPAAPAQVPGATQAAANPAPGSAPAAPAEGQAASASRPDWLPEDHWDSDAGAIKLDTLGKTFSELTAAQQAQAEAAAKLPKTAEEYKFALPADLQLPEGVQLALDDSNPNVQEFRKFAFENKLDPEKAQALFALGAKESLRIATEQARVEKAVNDRVAEEQKKLGPNHAERITNLATFLTSHIGEDFAKALVGEGYLWTAKQVQALEALQRKMSSQGAASPPSATAQAPVKEISFTDKLWPKRVAKA